MARIDRVFIDTSELYPFTVMDVLLTMSEELLLTWVWTDELLDEWEGVIVEGGLRTSGSARSVTDAVRKSFARSRIDPTTYRDRVADDLSPDPDDRVHVAACLHGGADVLPTRNTKDFPVDRLAGAGVRVQRSNSFSMSTRVMRRFSWLRTSRSASLVNPPVDMKRPTSWGPSTARNARTPSTEVRSALRLT